MLNAHALHYYYYYDLENTQCHHSAKTAKGDPSQAALYSIINIMASLIFFYT